MCIYYADAAIPSATLVDYAITSKVDKSQVIGPQKLGDKRKQNRKERREAELGNLKELTSLCFDVKNTMTSILVKNNKTRRCRPKIKVDDYYIVLIEFGNDCLTHVTPRSRAWKGGSPRYRVIYHFLVEHELTNQPLHVADCDICVASTKPNGGIIHHLKTLLARPMHYSICQLHDNELLFRAIFYYYNGKPSGP